MNDYTTTFFCTTPPLETAGPLGMETVGSMDDHTATAVSGFNGAKDESTQLIHARSDAVTNECDYGRKYLPPPVQYVNLKMLGDRPNDIQETAPGSSFSTKRVRWTQETGLDHRAPFPPAQSHERVNAELWTTLESTRTQPLVFEPSSSWSYHYDTIEDMLEDAEAESTRDEFYTPTEGSFPDCDLTNFLDDERELAVTGIDVDEDLVDINEPTIGWAEVEEAHRVQYIAKGKAKEVAI